MTEYVVAPSPNIVNRTVAQSDSVLYEDIPSKELSYSLTDVIMDEIGPLEHDQTMLFASALCEAYDAGESFPSEQRTIGLGSRDWRLCVRRGLWHILHSAVLAELDGNGLTDPEEVGSDSILVENATEHTLALSDRIPSPQSVLVFEFESEVIESLAGTLMDTDTDSVAVQDRPFIQVFLALSWLTDEHGLETWEGIADTNVREGLGNGHFCWNIPRTIIPEFRRELEDSH